MLHFFTDPYKDELIYSAIARYHYYTGNIDFMDTLEELFGKRSIVPSLEIGSNLNMLANNLGELYTADYIIKMHTIFPFYSPFLPRARKIQLLEDIKNKDGNGIYGSLGILAGSICKKKGIYYCPCCAKNEIEKLYEDVFKVGKIKVHCITVIDKLHLVSENQYNVRIYVENNNILSSIIESFDLEHFKVLVVFYDRKSFYNFIYSFK